MKKRISQVTALLMLFIALLAILIIDKELKITPILAEKYELTGVDVSHYQGTIDWTVLAGQELDFAFIKATEGSGHIDECFHDNWKEANKTNLCIGAYHFFSFDSNGEKQAESYIDAVGSLNGKMAPAIDVEFYGDKESNPPSKKDVAMQLSKMLRKLEEHYQAKPIIYTTYKTYDRYLKGEFEEYPLWIRNVYYKPLFAPKNRWTFWQYTDTAVLEGYKGAEKYIDMNVFRGTREDLDGMLVQCGTADSTYYDWCDGNEWLRLGKEGRLLHCLASNNGSCNYFRLMECTLNASGIKEIDYIGEGLEVCDVYEPDEAGLWWWEGEKPEIIQQGVYSCQRRKGDK